MKILFDTNVVLDVLLNREPYVADAIELFSAVENTTITGLLCATTLTTIEYLCAKQSGINGLVIRNNKDFTLAEYPIYTPKQLCNTIKTR